MSGYPGPGYPGPGFPPGPEPFSRRARRDLSLLWPALFLPLQAMRRFRLEEHRGLVALAAVGLAPLAIYDFVGHGLDVGGAFWALAFYFSAFWLVCFFVFFRGEAEVDGRLVAACYFGMSIFSVAVYLPLTAMPPLSWGQTLLQSNWATPLRPLIAVGVVGLPEELCKAAALFALWRAGLYATPRAMLFYGLVSGLGFGIREGVLYQMNYNDEHAGGDMALYYLANMLRLTSLPFLHAIWTGIAGYFVGYARMYAHRQAGLLCVAIALPAILHGLYDAFADGIAGLAFAVASVLLLGLYLHTSDRFAETLERDGPTYPPATPYR